MLHSSSNEKHHVSLPFVNSTRQNCKNWKRYGKKAQTAHTNWLQVVGIFTPYTHAQVCTLRIRVWMWLRNAHKQKPIELGSKAFSLGAGFPFGNAYQIGMVAYCGMLVGFILSVAGHHALGCSSLFVVGWVVRTGHDSVYPSLEGENNTKCTGGVE